MTLSEKWVHFADTLGARPCPVAPGSTRHKPLHPSPPHSSPVTPAPDAGVHSATHVVSFPCLTREPRGHRPDLQRVALGSRVTPTAVRLSVLFSFPQKGGRPGWGLIAVQDCNHFNRLRRHHPPPPPPPLVGEGDHARAPPFPVLAFQEKPNI